MSERCRVCARQRIPRFAKPGPGECAGEFDTECVVAVLVAARTSTNQARLEADQWRAIAEERALKVTALELNRQGLADALRLCVDQLEVEFGRGGLVYDAAAFTRSPLALRNRRAIESAAAALDDHA
jgi:hypothetical protein